MAAEVEGAVPFWNRDLDFGSGFGALPDTATASLTLSEIALTNR